MILSSTTSLPFRYLVVALAMILAAAAMFRDQVVLNTGGNVPVGFYIAADPADAEYVTFCLPPLPHGTHFDPALFYEHFQIPAAFVLRSVDFTLRQDQVGAVPERVIGTRGCSSVTSIVMPFIRHSPRLRAGVPSSTTVQLQT